MERSRSAHDDRLLRDLFARVGIDHHADQQRTMANVDAESRRERERHIMRIAFLHGHREGYKRGRADAHAERYGLSQRSKERTT